MFVAAFILFYFTPADGLIRTLESTDVKMLDIKKHLQMRKNNNTKRDKTFVKSQGMESLSMCG